MPRELVFVLDTTMAPVDEALAWLSHVLVLGPADLEALGGRVVVADHDAGHGTAGGGDEVHGALVGARQADREGWQR